MWLPLTVTEVCLNKEIEFLRELCKCSWGISSLILYLPLLLSSPSASVKLGCVNSFIRLNSRFWCFRLLASSFLKEALQENPSTTAHPYRMNTTKPAMSPVVPGLSLERLSMSSAGHVLQRKGIRNNPLYTENSSGCTVIYSASFTLTMAVSKLIDWKTETFLIFLIAASWGDHLLLLKCVGDVLLIGFSMSV